MRPLAMIAAANYCGVLPEDGKIPWYCPEDRKHFRETTYGHVVIMGRKTYESLGCKPLPNRVNIVLSSTLPVNTTDAANLFAAADIQTALDLAYAHDSCPFVIGGAETYAQFLPMATEIYLTYIPYETPPGDCTYFPELEGDWVVDSVTSSGETWNTYVNVKRI